MILIRPYSHGNEVSIYYDKFTNTFIKVSLSKKGKEFILADKKGIEWYVGNKDNNQISYVNKFWDLPNYTRLDLDKINGRIFNYNDNISKNKLILEMAINHYMQIWPKESQVPSHGDLTIDNIIVQNENIYIFDWEHFNSRGEIWGFDLAYLILSAISLPSFNKSKIPEQELDIFCYFWKKLLHLGLDIKIIKDPFYYFNNIFNNSKFWEKIIYISPNKMFPLVLSEGLKKQINAVINEKIDNV